MTDRIDTIDVRLLEILQEDGRAPLGRMAAAVDLAESSVSYRVRRLEELGVIRGYHARVSAKRIHWDTLAFVRLQAEGPENFETIVGRATEQDPVLEVHSITGTGSHLLKVRAPDMSVLRDLLAGIETWPGVHGTTTSVALTTFKETTRLPIEPGRLDRLGPE